MKLRKFADAMLFQSTPDSHEPGDSGQVMDSNAKLQFQSTPDSHEPGDTIPLPHPTFPFGFNPRPTRMSRATHQCHRYPCVSAVSIHARLA